MLKMFLHVVTGALVFQLKKRPPDYQARKGRKVDDKGLRGREGSSSSLPPEKLPYLVELSPGRVATMHTYMLISIMSAPACVIGLLWYTSTDDNCGVYKLNIDFV